MNERSCSNCLYRIDWICLNRVDDFDEFMAESKDKTFNDLKREFEDRCWLCPCEPTDRTAICGRNMGRTCLNWKADPTLFIEHA
jgi:hypothetical protein